MPVAEVLVIQTQLKISSFICSWVDSPFVSIDLPPWNVVEHADQLIREAMNGLSDEYVVVDDCAIHRTAVVEGGAILKGPMIIGPGCFIAASAYLRGGCYMGQNCTLGPGAELKTTFMFEGSKLAHLNFVGDSILGADVNVEAGAMIANYRNERADKQIRIVYASGVIATGVDKFGALVGDASRIGANAVIAPGAILAPETEVRRLALVDQAPTLRIESS